MVTFHVITSYITMCCFVILHNCFGGDTVNYRDLLNRCKQQPGWLASSDEKKKLAQAKYVEWVENMDREHKKNKTTQYKG